MILCPLPRVSLVSAELLSDLDLLEFDIGNRDQVNRVFATEALPNKGR